MELTPKAMEIEYIRIKRVNLEIEKAYATGLDAICILLIPPTDYYFSVSPNVFYYMAKAFLPACFISASLWSYLPRLGS